MIILEYDSDLHYAIRQTYNQVKMSFDRFL